MWINGRSSFKQREGKPWLLWSPMAKSDVVKPALAFASLLRIPMIFAFPPIIHIYVEE
jgi:hypothetical protein